MSDDEKQTPGVEPPNAEENAHDLDHSHGQPEVIDDARTRALAEALQSSFKIVRVIMVLLAVAFLGSGITTVERGPQGRLPPGVPLASMNYFDALSGDEDDDTSVAS